MYSIWFIYGPHCLLCNLEFWCTVTFGLCMDLTVYFVIFWSVSLSLHMDFTVNNVAFQSTELLCLYTPETNSLWLNVFNVKLRKPCRTSLCTMPYIYYISAMLRKEIVQSCDTQCTEGDCDVILIKNLLFLIIMHNL